VSTLADTTLVISFRGSTVIFRRATTQRILPMHASLSQSTGFITLPYDTLLRCEFLIVAKCLLASSTQLSLWGVDAILSGYVYRTAKYKRVYS
jgi:hypothetical protein